MKNKLSILLSLCLFSIGCSEEQVANLGGTPRAVPTKYFSVSACGNGIDIYTHKVYSYITMRIKPDAPNPLYLQVTFQSPEGEKVVKHQVTKEEFDKGLIDIKSPSTTGWKLGAYKTTVDVYSDSGYTNQLETFTQPWRYNVDLEKAAKNDDFKDLKK